MSWPYLILALSESSHVKILFPSRYPPNYLGCFGPFMINVVLVFGRNF